MKKIFITGGSGLLGVNLALCLRGKYDVHILLNKRLVNIKGVTAHKNKKKTKADFQQTFEKVNPDIIVNCVGYTDVDGCESDPNKSYNSNVGFASLVAKEASKQGKKFVHISTDHLFDGTKPFSSEQCLRV